MALNELEDGLQVRAIGSKGPSDWSDQAVLMAV
jgi:hypothetical protein